MINRIENRYNRLASDIFIFVIGTVLSKAIQFVLMPLYTSYMTTEAYGVAELTNNLSELFFPIATLCIYEAAFRFAVDPEFDNSNLAATAFDVVMKSAIVGALIALIAKYIFQYKYVIYLYFILYSFFSSVLIKNEFLLFLSIKKLFSSVINPRFLSQPI